MTKEAQCLMVNCRNRAPADEAFCAKHRNDNTPSGVEQTTVARIDDLCERLENCIRLAEHVTASPELLEDARACILALIDENARLREALELLRDLPIIENDGPDTLHIKGHAHTGPVVDYFFHAIRKIKEVARAALSPNPDQQED